MTTRRFVLLLGASILTIVGAMYLSSQRHLERDPRGESLLAGLDAQLDALTDVRLRKGGPTATVSLHRAAPGRWTVKERGDYPADLAKIRKLLLALADAKIIEEKTSNPANYAILGVEDPADAAAGGVELRLIAPASDVTVIVGKPAASGTFVRRGGEARSFAVEPPIAVEAAVRDWIEPALLSIPVEKIQRIRVQVADGAGYSISRKSAPGAAKPGVSTPGVSTPGVSTPGDFSLESAPAGREAADPATIAPSPTSFSGITADDVAAAAQIDFSKPSTCQITLLDGSSYMLTGTTAADKHWIKAAATKDDALNARALNRAFEVAGYRYDAIFRPVEQLLKPKPVKPKAANPAKKPAAPH
jgi:hypothetical protein